MNHSRSSAEQIRIAVRSYIIRTRDLVHESQESFAKRFDCSDELCKTSGRTVRNWESGKALPRLDKLINLANSLKRDFGITTKLDEFFIDEDDIDDLLLTYNNVVLEI